MSAYYAGVDLGTTFSAAAVYRDGQVEMMRLGGAETVIPSLVLLRDDGSVVTGFVAEQQGLVEPDRLARHFKRRIGSDVPVQLGSASMPAHLLQARLLRWVVDRIAEQEGGPPDRLAITHPASWSAYRLDYLDQAIDQAHVGETVTVSEPEAAAIHYASLQRVEPGTLLAVYDLGGGTFDAAVLRKTGDGFEIVGQPQGVEVGGIDFDDALYGQVLEHIDTDAMDTADPAVAAGLRRLREDVEKAKRVLSTLPNASIAVMLPGAPPQVRVTRAEFEQAIRPSVDDTIAALRRTLDVAGIAPGELSLVLLVGGSSRIPLVSQMVEAELGVPTAVDTDPKNAIAKGAALVAAGETAAPASVDDPAMAGVTVDDDDDEVDREVPAALQPSRWERLRDRVADTPTAAWIAAAAVAALVAAVGVVLLRPNGLEPQPTVAATTTPAPTTAETLPPTAAEPTTSTTAAPPTTVPPTTTTEPAPTTTVARPAPVVTDVIAVGDGPNDVVVAQVGVFVTNELDGTVTRIDPVLRTVEATIPVGERPVAVAAGAQSVWVANFDDGTVTRFSLIDDAVTATIAVGEGPGDLAFGDNSVWVTNSGDRSVSRIDARTDEVVATIAVDEPPVAVAFGDGAVWVATQEGEFGNVVRIDPDDDTVTDSIPVSSPCGLATEPGSVWFTDFLGNGVGRIDTATRQFAAGSIDLPRGPCGVVVADGAVWVGAFEAAAVVRVDPEALEAVGVSVVTDFVETLEFPRGLAFGDGGIWVAHSADDSVSLIRP